MFCYFWTDQIKNATPLGIEVVLIMACNGVTSQVTLYLRFNLLPHSGHSFAFGLKALPQAVQ
jgi:hypothetical protein